MRNITILINRFKELPLSEFLTLLKEALFINIPIIIYKFELSPREFKKKLFIDGIRFGKGELYDLEVASKTLMPLPWEFRCHEFDGVKDFFIAKDHVGVQHISWVYLHEHRNRLLALGEKEAEIKFCLTMPAFRGRGIYPHIIGLILDHLHSTGIERVFMCVHSENVPSIRGIEKAGFTRAGEIRLRKIMGMQISPRYDANRRVS